MNALDIPQCFAAALDENDFNAAGALLAEHCVYEFRGKQVLGRASIMATYTNSADWAAANLDGLTYESAVETVSAAVARITFTDHVTYGDKQHTYQCQQLVTIDGGLIERIQHEELDGEREALDEFFRDCGLKR